MAASLPSSAAKLAGSARDQSKALVETKLVAWLGRST